LYHISQNYERTERRICWRFTSKYLSGYKIRTSGLFKKWNPHKSCITFRKWVFLALKTIWKWVLWKL